jgi:hypothetical protein
MPHVHQVGNVFFLARLGSTVRESTSDITQEQLPEPIRLLLEELERVPIKPLTGAPQGQILWFSKKPEQSD